MEGKGKCKGNGDGNDNHDDEGEGKGEGKKKGKGDGKKLFEVKAGSGKDDSSAKNLRKRNAQSPVVETRQQRK